MAGGRTGLRAGKRAVIVTGIVLVCGQENAEEVANKMSNWLKTSVCLILLAGAGTVWGQVLNDHPRREDPLHVRVACFENLLRANHLNEGTVTPNVIFAPAGLAAPVVGRAQEDVAFVTGEYLAALSFRYAVTQDAQVRAWADEVLEGILKLESVTDELGYVARAFYRADEPAWHEQAFFFPQEWRQSTALPEYRWLGDLSSDQFTGLVFGLTVYWEICADDAHKKTAAEFLDRLVGRCVENNFRIMDTDGKMTLWGNFCPDLPHEYLNALLMLSHLRSAAKVTGNAAFEAAYNRLIAKYHYDDQAILAKVLWPAEQRNPSDDFLAAMGLYHLMRFEPNADLLQKYRMGLNRHWHVWKDGGVQPFLPMVYQVLTQELVFDSATLPGLPEMWGAERAKQSWTVPTEAGTQSVEAEDETVAIKPILSYWFGRYHKLIEATL